MLQNDKVVFSFRGPMGVQVDIGQSIVFLMALILFLNLSGNILNGVIIIAILFGSIYLHELGHAWGNKVQGIPVRRILMHGGGGLCEAARSGTPRERELVVAMGPLVNLALWAIAGITVAVLNQRLAASPTEALENATLFQFIIWIEFFGFINILLFAFNLIPVQPLDGGKLLHLFLLRFMQPPTALKVTGAIGLVAAILWIPSAIFLFMSWGFILFFFPSVKLHWLMFQGRAVF